ncbi:cilia- and flagella-associated protein 52-like [Limulus polyphemus]|uniref:Cilia- and flagella-associated protein 52 n=1 Tax=Limulus polyphemus TaxID=6850 RepID=A0ABM1RX90_LIMPO|nr:cilia- and flagella-associated protein 52-like [Limulus polyphemus]XP_022235995.1 cilia- and flagella-associated protein 52-like [Limulus polyphemus]XP_022235997.1 cilia- and flagella-associated protein 52-like [Limulus polyphemus]
MSRHGGQEGLSELELLATIGFEGKVKGGLKLHHDCSNLIYALGNTIVIKDITRNNFTFLNGHTNSVSCLAVSKSGQYLASGQINFMGFKAKVIIWDFKKQQEWAGHELHKVKVEAVVFSASEQYLFLLVAQMMAVLLYGTS